MANIQIPNLISAGPLNGNDLLVINQSGLTKKITANDFLHDTIVTINNDSSNFIQIIDTVSSTWNSSLNASVTTITEAIASESYILAEQITNVAVTNGRDLSASVLSLNQAIISNSTILAQQINALSVNVNGKLSALAGVLNKAIVDNSHALFSQFVGISGSLNNKIDFQVGQLGSVIINDSQMLFNEMNGISLSLSGALDAAVGTLNQAIISNSATLFSQINGIRIDTNNSLTAFVGTLNQAIISNSAALFSQINGISASLAHNITVLSTTVRDAILSNSSILASQITTVSSQLSANIAAGITQALTTVADVSHTLAQEIDTLTAHFGDITGTIQLIQSVEATNSELLLQRIEIAHADLSGQIVNASQGLHVEILANSVTLVSYINSVSSSVNGLSGSVSSVISSSGALNNAWTLTLDSNGYISGLKSVNNGTVASFDVSADTFTVGKSGSTVKAFNLNTSTMPPTLTFLGKITANSLVSGTISTANLYVGNATSPGPNYMALEGPQERMVVQDGNGQERVRIGYLNNNAPGSNVEAYGITVRDRGGNLIVGAGGLGNNVVYPNNIPPGTTSRAYGNHIGDGSAIVGGAKYVLGNIVINVAVGEGMMIMTSGLFTNGNATVAAPPTPVVVTPPAQTPTYVPPDYRDPGGPEFGGGGSGG
jgi:hypothetical protein